MSLNQPCHMFFSSPKTELVHLFRLTATVINLNFAKIAKTPLFDNILIRFFVSFIFYAIFGKKIGLTFMRTYLWTLLNVAKSKPCTYKYLNNSKILEKCKKMGVPFGPKFPIIRIFAKFGKIWGFMHWNVARFLTKIS